MNSAYSDARCWSSKICFCCLRNMLCPFFLMVNHSERMFRLGLLGLVPIPERGSTSENWSWKMWTELLSCTMWSPGFLWTKTMEHSETAEKSGCGKLLMWELREPYLKPELVVRVFSKLCLNRDAKLQLNLCSPLSQWTLWQNWWFSCLWNSVNAIFDLVN